MQKNNNFKFRVALLIPLVSKASRDRTAGILRFAAAHLDWETFIVGEHAANSRLDDITEWRADGLITTPDYLKHPERAGGLKARSIVIADGRDLVPPEGCRRFGAVVCDNPEVGRRGAEFLHRKKYSHFAFVDMPEPQAWSGERLIGFREALAEHGFTCSVFQAQKGMGWKAEEESLAEFLASIPKPCGLMAAVDGRAKHVLDACQLVGIDVPRQLGVLGADNDEMTCEWTRPTLSSVLPEFESSGYRLAEMLDALMRGHPVRTRIQLYGVTGVVERFSTLDLTGSARIVSKAREYIRKNAATDITLADIATAAGCSERVLQRRFREVSGKPPVEELRKRRLEIVCDMLARTETPVDLVGGFCGFNSNSNLKAAFKTRYGLSMSEWRNRARGIGHGLPHHAALRSSGKSVTKKIVAGK